MLYEKLHQAIADNRGVALATLVVKENGRPRHLLIDEDGQTEGTLGDGQLDRQVAADAAEAIRLDESVRKVYETADGQASVFIGAHNPPPRLICFGAVHVAEYLTKLGKVMGFRTVLIDPREQLATKEKFGHVDELLLAWPQDVAGQLGLNRSSFVAILTHDPKFDEPALVASLDSDVRYVGLLGSKKTVQKRLERLAASGVPAEQIARIRTPIGLNLGSDRAEVIALGILAEMIQIKYRGTGRPMEEKRLNPVAAAVVSASPS